MTLDRRLIEEWLPIAEIGIESGRERGASSALPPIYYLHTWWARRPLVLSRAAVLASILPAGADRKKFLDTLGIHGDPIQVRSLIDQANQEGKKLGNPYGYKRAFSYIPSYDDRIWLNNIMEKKLNTMFVLDPTAGGGSISLESQRLGCTTIMNDINPVAALLLHATIHWPSTFGAKLLDEFQDLHARFISGIKTKYYADMLPALCANTALLARTIPCPHCSGVIPLSPNWRIAPDGTGVRLKPHISDGPGSEGRICSFQIVQSIQEQSEGTVSRGDGVCPYPDCRRAISGDKIKTAAKSGNMGEQLYAIEYKKRTTTRTKTGKLREKWIKKYREPDPDDYNAEFINAKLEEKLQEWDVYDIVPTETYNRMYADRSKIYGVNYWRDLFSPRQLLYHGTSVEVFRELLDQDRQNGRLTDIRKAAYGYLAISLDTLINYNSRLTTWHANRTIVGPTFARHDYGFSWSYVEMAPLVAGLGYEWAFNKTIDSLKGLITLTGSTQNTKLDSYTTTTKNEPKITCKPGDNLDHIKDGIIDVVVIDPPYYDNVMYAELSDFFYVWLKRTAGLVFPELFQRNLTDKENEAVANPTKFAGQKGAKAMAGKDYEDRMRLIFAECRRVLKPSGIMTVMFMHKSTRAWNAIAKSIIKAGFYITTSWPINSEARGSLHIRGKAAAKSTILLACRPRPVSDTISYWEDIEPKVRESVRNKIDRFEKAGMRGIDIYLSAFGPALEAFSSNWPMKRISPMHGADENDLYSVTPEDALMTARREVKRWRLGKLIRSTPNKDLDPVTAFFVLAWDAFGTPKFPYDEALYLAKAVNVDLDRDVVGRLAKKAGEYLILLDSQKSKSGTRRARSQVMIDMLHRAAYIGREEGAEEAIKYIESEQLDSDESFVAALEAILKVLPPSANRMNKIDSASSDSEALFNISRLKFSDKIGDPNQHKLP